MEVFAIMEYYLGKRDKYSELSVEIIVSENNKVALEETKLCKISEDNRKNHELGQPKLVFSMGEIEKINQELDKWNVTTLITADSVDRDLTAELFTKYSPNKVLSLKDLIEKLSYKKRDLVRENFIDKEINRKYPYASEIGRIFMYFHNFLVEDVFKSNTFSISISNKLHISTCRYHKKGKNVNAIDFLSNDYEICKTCLGKKILKNNEEIQEEEVTNNSANSEEIVDGVLVEEKNNIIQEKFEQTKFSLNEQEDISSSEEGVRNESDEKADITTQENSESRTVLAEEKIDAKSTETISQDSSVEETNEEFEDTRSEIERYFVSIIEQDGEEISENNFVKVYSAGTNLETRTEELKQKRDATKNILKYYEYDTSYLASELGLFGEDKLLEELQYSFIELIVIKDLTLSYVGLSAQIDFLVITSKAIYILEAKNYLGSVHIDKNRNFLRNTETGNSFRIANPLNQVTRQLNILKGASQNYYDFDNLYGFVVMTADETMISMDEDVADEEVGIINLDNLIRTINEIEDQLEIRYSRDEMENIAKFLLDRNKSSGNVYSSEEREINERIVRNNLLENMRNKISAKQEAKKRKEALSVKLKTVKIKKASKEFETILNNYLARKAYKKNIDVTKILTESMKDEIFQVMPNTEEKLNKLMVKNSFYYSEIRNDLLSMINQELKK